jgi:hypothetical protein
MWRAASRIGKLRYHDDVRLLVHSVAAGHASVDGITTVGVVSVPAMATPLRVEHGFGPGAVSVTTTGTGSVIVGAALGLVNSSRDCETR